LDIVFNALITRMHFFVLIY